MASPSYYILETDDYVINPKTNTSVVLIKHEPFKNGILYYKWSNGHWRHIPKPYGKEVEITKDQLRFYKALL